MNKVKFHINSTVLSFGLCSADFPLDSAEEMEV